MADSSTTHLNLIKQDLDAAPDFGKENTNLDTLDSEIYARAKTFNGEPVGEDGGFHINTVPFAENLQSYSGQSSDGTFIVRTTGGSASIDNGDASVTLIRGARTHYGYSPQSVSEPAITMMPREEGEEEITAEIDNDTFIAAVSSASGTVTFNYSTAWSPDVATYGITVTGTPLAGDSISVTYAKEVPGTIVQSNPQKFISTGWNLYNHNKGYARATNYSSDYGYKISGTYVSIGFSETEDGTQEVITPVNGLFTVPGDGYVFVTGGNNTDTAIWPTWSDWVLGYRWDEVAGTSGAFQTYTESVIDLSSLFGENKPFPYGLMQVGDVHDEINLNTRFATSYIMRIENTAGNMSSAVSSGREFEYDEDYIYIVRESPIIYSANISGEYTADDHGIEYFTETEQAVSVHTIYGSNLKNKLERDVLTISQQTLNVNEKNQVQKNIGVDRLNGLFIYSTDDLNNYHNHEDTGLYNINNNTPANCPLIWSQLVVIGSQWGACQLLIQESDVRLRRYTGSPLHWTEWKPLFPKYVDINVTLGTTQGYVGVNIPSWNSSNVMLSATFLYNDALYYATITDSRQLTISMQPSGAIEVIQKGGPWSTSRTLKVRVHYI